MDKQHFNLLLIFLIFCGLPIGTNIATGVDVVYAENNHTSGDESITTEYHITLDEAVEIQANASAPPITSIYSNDFTFVQKKNMRIINPVRLFGITFDVWEAPTIDSGTVYQFLGTTPIYVKDFVIGDRYNDSNVWFEIAYKSESYYIHSSSIFPIQITAVSDANVFELSNTDSHVFGQINKGKMMTVIDAETNWYKVSYNYWRVPKKRRYSLLS